jgi:hypothetical protein
MIRRVLTQVCYFVITSFNSYQFVSQKPPWVGNNFSNTGYSNQSSILFGCFSSPFELVSVEMNANCVFNGLLRYQACLLYKIKMKNYANELQKKIKYYVENLKNSSWTKQQVRAS